MWRARGRVLAATAAALVALATATATAGADTPAATFTPAAVPVPASLVNPSVSLPAVACPAVHDCVAVGRVATDGVTMPLVLSRSAGRWVPTTVPLPVGVAGGFLENVACSAPSACEAVGVAVTDSGADAPLVLTGSGTSWSAQVAPLPANALALQSGGALWVACTPTFCALADTYQTTGGLEVYVDTTTGSGTSATEVPLPPGGVGANSVGGIACDADGCTVVGVYSDAASARHGLIVTGAGSSWSALEAPLPTDAAASQGTLELRAPSCGADGCIADGSYAGSNGTEGLLLTGAGGTWTATTAPLPADAAADSGADVSVTACPPTGGCVATEDYETSTGHEAGAVLSGGPAWVATETELPAGATAFGAWAVHGLTCPAATSCEALASYTLSGGATAPMVVSGSGTTWTTRAAPLPSGAQSGAVLGVGCPGPGTCAAVGSYVDAEGRLEGLILDGAATVWRAARAPIAASIGDDHLATFSMACPAAGRCDALGTDSSSSEDVVLWTESGTRWQSVLEALPAGLSSFTQPYEPLQPVACSSATRCLAVGSASDSDTPAGVLFVRTGSQWSAVEAPLPGADAGASSRLDGAACPASGACVAVGTDGHGLVEVEVLGSFRPVDVPTPVGGTADGVLDAAACPAAGRCVAVGSEGDTLDVGSGLIASQSHGTWGTVVAPAPAGSASGASASLDFVTCQTTASCEAAGTFTDSSGITEPEALTLDGTAWSATQLPLPADADPTAPQVQLTGFACASSSSCTAVGSYESASGVGEGFIDTGAGSSWSTTTAPLPSGAPAGEASAASAVGCSAGGACLVTGTFVDAAGVTQSSLITGSGTAWSATEAPLPADATVDPTIDLAALLLGATCPGACGAFGLYIGAHGFTAFTETPASG